MSGKAQKKSSSNTAPDKLASKEFSFDQIKFIKDRLDEKETGKLDTPMPAGRKRKKVTISNFQRDDASPTGLTFIGPAGKHKLHVYPPEPKRSELLVELVAKHIIQIDMEPSDRTNVIQTFLSKTVYMSTASYLAARWEAGMKEQVAATMKELRTHSHQTMRPPDEPGSSSSNSKENTDISASATRDQWEKEFSEWLRLAIKRLFDEAMQESAKTTSTDTLGFQLNNKVDRMVEKIILLRDQVARQDKSIQLLQEAITRLQVDGDGTFAILKELITEFVKMRGELDYLMAAVSSAPDPTQVVAERESFSA